MAIENIGGLRELILCDAAAHKQFAGLKGIKD